MAPAPDEFDESELSHRRERGRLAQRAFRQRQIDTIRELREENKALRDAISKLSQVTAGPALVHGSNHDTLHHAAIHVSGFPGAGFELAEHAGDIEAEYAPETHSNHSVATVKPSNHFQDFSTHNRTAFNLVHNTHFTSQAQAQAIQLAPFTTPAQHDSPPPGRLSPRLTYGLWFEPDRALKVVHAPPDIVPFLGEGVYSFGGAVFWTSASYALPALRDVVYRTRFSPSPSPPPQSSSAPYPQQHLHTGQDGTATPAASASSSGPSSPSAGSGSGSGSGSSGDSNEDRLRTSTAIVQKLFGMTLHLASERTLYDLIHARVVWRVRGSLTGDHPGRDPEAGIRLFADTVADPCHMAALGDLRFWMDPAELDAYVRARLSATPAGWAPWAAVLRGGGSADPARTYLLGRLVRLFSTNSTCVAGPRWRVDTVQRFVDAWLAEVSSYAGFGPIEAVAHVPEFSF
ncbi:hypothetical protein B0T24DRAFT_289613 [Lasiosphaeria ovina]|uniref:BZIP domain-containing protein n=1 Tax=Lasiosphaeria ovina TaxID=92902 RepID=A0AAE0KCB5_9PEZI|nr:hypothetical protein B0T24DRAFT_289613 [Lasiosphaeria ovina]